MHFSWERMPQLTQARYQYEVSSKEGKKRTGTVLYSNNTSGIVQHSQNAFMDIDS